MPIANSLTGTDLVSLRLEIIYEARGDSLGFVTNILAAKIAMPAQEVGDRQVTPRYGKNGVLDA
jgi:hypothetical protein